MLTEVFSSKNRKSAASSTKNARCQMTQARLAWRRSFLYRVRQIRQKGQEDVIKKRILVIEDDRDIVELVRYNLEKDGFQVLTAADGSTGMAQVKKTPPDLLVLDLMLPKLSGLEICKEIRRDPSL